jgi:hypothetical protein
MMSISLCSKEIQFARTAQKKEIIIDDEEEEAGGF